MELSAKKEALLRLGEFFTNCVKNLEGGELLEDELDLSNNYKIMHELADTVKSENGWFTKDSVLKSLDGWSKSLQENKIEQWLNEYDFKTTEPIQKVGVIMAGNIPLVGLHDSLCVLLTGNVLHAKLSSKDRRLMSLILNVIGQISSEWKSRIKLVEQLKEVDVLIATGSDNSARYFDYYFRDRKRLIRKNRTSIAVLNGSESEEDLIGLSHDVFVHYGLGCRNVTKIYIPMNYDLDRIFRAFFDYKEIGNHNKYGNNYDYNKAVYLLNNVELIENGFILFKEDKGLHSPVGVLFYEYYSDVEEVHEKLMEKEDSIQCIVTNIDVENRVPFGKAQQPELWDYADRIDTINFLTEEQNI